MMAAPAGSSFESPKEEAAWKDCETAQKARAKGKCDDADLMEMMAESSFPGIVQRYKESLGSVTVAPAERAVAAAAASPEAGLSDFQKAYAKFKRTSEWLELVAKAEQLMEVKSSDPNHPKIEELEYEIFSESMEMPGAIELFEKIDADGGGTLSATEIQDGFQAACDSIADIRSMLDVDVIGPQLSKMSSSQELGFADFFALMQVCKQASE